MSTPPPERAGQDVAAILARAALPRHTMTVCLDSELRDEWVRANDALEAAVEQERREALAEVVNHTLADRGQHQRLRDEVRALEQRMQEGSLRITLQALPRGEYRRLIRQHRECEHGDDICARFRFCVDEVFPALFAASLVEPALTDEQRDVLFGRLSDGQMIEIIGNCISLNQVSASVPFSRAASLPIPTSEGESRRRGASGSRSPSSKARNSAGSRSTSTTSRAGSSGR